MTSPSSPITPARDAPRIAPDLVLVLSHTHWDREWYLPAVRFRQRLVRLIDQVLDRQDGGAHFLLDGQAVMLEDYLSVRPERQDEISRALRSGAIEAGPWYVLADELIPSGESLVRNLLAGRRIVRTLGGAPPRVLYSPDAFGHPAALPLVARDFDMPLVILWRGLGGTGWPRGDAMRWRAADGSEVLVHHLPPSGYEYGANLPVDASGASLRWRELEEMLAPRSTLGAVLILNGADHHALQSDFGRALTALREAAAPLPARETTLREMAAELVSRAADRSDIPEIRGELRRSYGYTWTLQGTFATREPLKLRHAAVERLLWRDAEPWSALARAEPGTDGSLVRAAWRSLLLCQPHDTLCGCSLDAVALGMRVRLDEAEVQAIGIREDAVLAMVGHDPRRARIAPSAWRSVVLVRNPSPRQRTGIAELEILRRRAHVSVGPGSGGRDQPESEPGDFLLDAGALLTQRLDTTRRHDRVESPEHYPSADLVDATRLLAWMPEIGGYGVHALTISDAPADHPRHASSDAPSSPGSGVPNLVAVTTEGLDNGRMRLTVDAAGALSLTDRTTGAVIPDVVSFEDVGDAGDCYTHSPILPSLTGGAEGRARVVLAGPLRGALALDYTMQIPSATLRSGRSPHRVALPLTVIASLDAGSAVLRLAVQGENVARDHRLRMLVRTGVRPRAVLADAAFGPVRRDPILVADEDARAEHAPTTAPMHRYVTVEGDDRGATVIGGSTEYEVLDDGTVALTLVRAVGELSRADLPERPVHAGWPEATPLAQCLGPIDTTVGLLLHGQGDVATITEIEHTADDFLLPLTGTTLRSALELPGPIAGLTLEGSALAFAACKESEDGEWIVLRCVNISESPQRGRWTLGRPLREARRSALDERVGPSMTIAGSSVEFEAPSRGVVTLIVR